MMLFKKGSRFIILKALFILFITLLSGSMESSIHSSLYFEHGKQVAALSSNTSASTISSNKLTKSNGVWTPIDGNASSDDKYIAYGNDNLHPLRLQDIQRKSLQHSNIVSIASSLIGGQVKFKIKDKEGDLTAKDEQRLKEAKTFYQAANILTTHSDRAYNLYSYGYAPVLMNWKVGAEPGAGTFQVGQRDSVDFRLGSHTNTFFGLMCKYHYYHYDWTKVPINGSLGNVKPLSPKSYFARKKIDHSKILRVLKFDQAVFKPLRGSMYSHMIGMPKRSNKFYPRPFFESDVFWRKVYGEDELSIVERNGVKKGLHMDYIANVHRKIYYNPEQSQAEMLKKQKKIDVAKVEQKLGGFKNAGNVQVNFIGINLEGEKLETDGNIEIIPIPSNNNFTEINGRQTSLDRYIRSAHSLTVPEIAGLNDSKSGFSNIAEFLRVGAEVYIDNAIRPHIEKIDTWHNSIVNKNNGFKDIETFTEPPVIALRALISEFKDLLTINEARRDLLNRGGLDKEEMTNVIGYKANQTKNANQVSKRVLKSLDDNTINDIAIAVSQKMKAA